MTFEEYTYFVEEGVSLDPDTDRERLMFAGMGLAGEAGEVCDHIKKVVFHGKKMDRAALIKEMGDVLWYFTMLLGANSLVLDQIMEANVRKLCERYPHKHGDPEDIIAGATTTTTNEARGLL